MATVDDHSLARRVAMETGELLVELRAGGADGSPYHLRAEGDRRAHLRILELLHDARPDDAVLSEEGLDDRHRPLLPPFSYSVAAAMDAALVPMGSAGAKAMAVVRGDVDVSAHAGGMYEWDSAAPAAVAASAGLHVPRVAGPPPRYNRPDPWLP